MSCNSDDGIGYRIKIRGAPKSPRCYSILLDVGRVTFKRFLNNETQKATKLLSGHELIAGQYPLELILDFGTRNH